MPAHILERPLITPGVEGGAFTVTVLVLAAEVPQPFDAVTDIVPLEPAVALMLFVVLLPTQPEGNAQL